MKVELPKGVTIVQTSGGRGGCCNFLKKKLWLRMYHILAGGDWNPFLLDAFGNPVHFNYMLNQRGSDMDNAIINGYSSSMVKDIKRFRGSMVVPLERLIRYPFLSFKNWPVTITSDDNYRIGDPEKECIISFRNFTIDYQ